LRCALLKQSMCQSRMRAWWLSRILRVWPLSGGGALVDVKGAGRRVFLAWLRRARRHFVLGCRGATLGLLTAVLAGPARVLVGGCLAVDSFFFPAGLVAVSVFRAVHAAWTSLHLPARVEAKVMSYRGQVQTFKRQPLDELQPS
jgi:hypothetical protein